MGRNRGENGVITAAVFVVLAGITVLAGASITERMSEGSPSIIATALFKARTWGMGIDTPALPEQPASEYTVVDLRDAEAFAAGHVPGAINVPTDNLVFFMSDLAAAATPILAYCSDDLCALPAVNALRMAGYERVHYLNGGWRAWLAHGRATTR